MTTAVIVDDEPALRDQLEQLLAKLWPELEIIACIGDGERAIETIQQQQPDLTFLDIQMPGKDGLQVAAAVATYTRIIFITAYDHYAVKAFELEAIDYLLKPVSEARMQQTIERIRQSTPLHDTALQLQLQQLSDQLAEQKSTLQWIRALKGERTHLIHVDDVLFFHAEDKYTTVATREGEYLIRKPIKVLEQELNHEQYWRIHRSTIVKVSAIASSHHQLSGGYRLTIHGSQRTLKVSRSYAHRFKQM